MQYGIDGLCLSVLALAIQGGIIKKSNKRNGKTETETQEEETEKQEQVVVAGGRLYHNGSNTYHRFKTVEKASCDSQ